MKSISEAMKAYMLTHPFDSGDPDCETVLDQLYHAYAESMSMIPKKLVTVSRSWRNICVFCPWRITTQFLICVAACAVHTNAKPLRTACNTAQN